MATARVSDWPGWLARYRRAPVWVHVAAWSVLLGIYHLTTFPPLIGLCWLAAVLLCLAQPQVGLWLAVALIPFYYQHKEVQLVDGVLIAPPAHVLVLALLPAVFLARQGSGAPRPFLTVGVLSCPSPFAPRPLIWWELAPLLLLPLSLLAAVNVWQWPAFGRGLLDLVIAPLLLWLAVRRLAHTESERRRVLAALVTGGVLAAGVGLAGWLGGGDAEVDGIRRLVGPHFSPNHTALYLERSLFVGLALLIVAARRWRMAAVLALLIMATALLLTGSRGALLLGVPVGLAVLAGFALRRRPGLRRWLRMRRRRIGAAALGGVLLILLVIAWQRARLANVETLELRLEVWRAALALWRAHFWAGVGPGGFFWSYPAYLRVGAVEVDQLHPHSVWLELVTMWGVGGLAWFTLCIVALLKALRSQSQASGAIFWIAAGACAGLAAGVAHAQTDTFLGLADLAAWNAVAWALATAPGESVSVMTDG
jgi:O-antigen ligase